MVNEWTRDDLPRVVDLLESWDTGLGDGFPLLVSHTIDAVVDHLNTHHPKPERSRDLRQDAAAFEQSFIDERARAEKAESVRDEALDRYRTLQAEYVRQAQAWSVKRADYEDRLARAEAAEARLADPYSEANQDAAAWDRVAAHPTLRMDLLPEAEHTYAGRVFERITWLAEVAEAVTEMKPAEVAESRTAPAVTREDVKGVIDHWIEQGGNHEALLDDLWRWVSGADPAVHVVRESDISAVEVERDSHGEWFADGEHVYANGAADSRNLAGGYMQKAIRRLAVARAIEAEQAVDPVEALAEQIETAAREAIRKVCVLAGAVAPGLDDGVVEEMLDITSESRRLAAYVLEQEATR